MQKRPTIGTTLPETVPTVVSIAPQLIISMLIVGHCYGVRAELVGDCCRPRCHDPLRYAPNGLTLNPK